MPATPKGLSDEKAARIMLGLRSGRTLRKFWVSSATLEAYLAAHPEYAREARPLMEANAKSARLRKGANYRDKTHCKHGHPLSGDNLYIAPKRNERKCRTCVGLRQQAPKPANQKQIVEATAALTAGMTISQICWGIVCGKKVSAPILGFSKLKLHRQLNPDFNQFVVSSVADHNSKGQRRRWGHVRTNVIRSENNDYHKIRAMLPANFPGADDVVSDIFEALLDGSLQLEDVKARAKQFIAAHYRMFPTNFAKFGDSRLVSLDEAVFADGTTTRGDTISRGLWD